MAQQSLLLVKIFKSGGGVAILQLETKKFIFLTNIMFHVGLTTKNNIYTYKHKVMHICVVRGISVNLICLQEKAYREATESRQNQSIAEYVQIKDREKEARFELQHTQEQLKKEQEKTRNLMEKVNVLSLQARSKQPASMYLHCSC